MFDTVLNENLYIKIKTRIIYCLAIQEEKNYKSFKQ